MKISYVLVFFGVTLSTFFSALLLASDSFSTYNIPQLKEEPFFENKDVLVAGGDVGAYATPSMVVTQKGTILIFVDLRLGNVADFGNLHEAICIRSTDDGKTWSKPIKLAASPDRVYYPLFVYANAGTIAAVIGGDRPLKTKDGRVITEKMLLENPDILKGIEVKAPFTMVSRDDGLTWERSEDKQFFGYDGCWGSCITLKYGDKKGRMIQPSRVWLDKVEEFKECPAGYKYSFNCVNYSDDGGKTWHKGGLSQPCCGECCVVELSDGRVYLSNRNHSSIRNIRSYAISRDFGETFAEFGFNEELIEPICHASMIRYSDPDRGNVILFANPASKTSRVCMTVRASMDDCITWPVKQLIDPGKTGYSVIGVTPKGTIILVYERGEKDYRADIAVARFNISWLFQ